MSLAELKIITIMEFEKSSQTEKKIGLLAKKIVYGPPPTEIYIEMTDFTSGTTTKYPLFKGYVQQTIGIDYDNHDTYDYYLDNNQAQEAKREAMKLLSELSNKQWKVRKASDKIIAYLSEINRKIDVPRLKELRSITISTLDEP